MGIFRKILMNRKRIRALRSGTVIRLDPTRPKPSRVIRLRR